MKGRQKSLVPRFFSFFLFSGVLMTWMRRPDTSVFLLFPLFRGDSDWDDVATHHFPSPFPLFSVVPPSPLQIG